LLVCYTVQYDLKFTQGFSIEIPNLIIPLAQKRGFVNLIDKMSNLMIVIGTPTHRLLRDVSSVCYVGYSTSSSTL